MTTPARVIVVDDDASIRDAIADCLLLHGYQVRVAVAANVARRHAGELQLLHREGGGLVACLLLGKFT